MRRHWRTTIDAPLGAAPLFALLLATVIVVPAAPAAAVDAPDAASSDTPSDPAALAAQRQAEAYFEAKVRPLLAARCFECHGPEKQESSLRLDSRAGVFKGGDRGPAAVAGNPDDSHLVQAIRYGDEDLQMPPTAPLDAQEVAILETWVKSGLAWPDAPSGVSAAWKTHWAFQPVVRPALPDTANADWARNSVDRFVLARLEAAGLAPSPEADRRTLIRRLAYDLVGLPPTPEEVAAFEADPAPDSYERLVDRLLASPAYGERWGRYWLDVARYADNKGYVFFEEKTYPWSYTYRDWVIESLNADLPYDRFVLEQLAADQLDADSPYTDSPSAGEAGTPSNPRDLRAMGFLTIGGHFMNNTHDIVDDRIDVIARGLMGLTVTCARCHDHKYDPIPTADYYSLYGVLRSSYEPLVPPLCEPAPDTEEQKKYQEELDAAQKKLAEFVQGKHAELVGGARARAGEYLAAAHAAQSAPSTDGFMLLTDTGELNPVMIVRWQLYLEGTAGHGDPVWEPWHALEALKDDEFASAAASVLRQLQTLGTLPVSQEGNPQPAGGDGPSPAGQPINPLALAALTEPPLESMNDVAHRYGELLASIDQKWKAALEQATASGNPPPTALDDPAEEQLRHVLYGPEAPPDVPVEMGWGFLDLLPDRPSQQEFEKRLKEVEACLVKGPPRAMVLLDRPQPYNPRIFLRGNASRPGEPVPRQFPAVVDPDRKPFQHGSGRLELARAVVDPANPLTGRVIVNRLWQQHFGDGLVRTPGDFGLRSEPPSHPALLDYLADSLVEGGWSLKKMHRRMVLSAAYRQMSVDRPECLEADPENRFLWKMNRRRLQFEALRDTLLAASGSLDSRMGGPPVQEFGDAFSSRRTVYAFIDRMDLPPILSTFDFPIPVATSPQRDTTTVPPQALYLMNHPFVLEAATRLIHRPDVSSLTDKHERIDRLYRIVLGRPPTAHDTELADEFLGPELDDQAWSLLAHVLLLTNEMAFVD